MNKLLEPIVAVMLCANKLIPLKIKEKDLLWLVQSWRLFFGRETASYGIAIHDMGPVRRQRGLQAVMGSSAEVCSVIASLQCLYCSCLGSAYTDMVEGLMLHG